MGFAVGSTHPTVPLFVSRTRPSRWGLSNLHRLLAPLLDAAVASVQAQTKPVPAGRKITGLDVRTEADIRMLRIGGDLPRSEEHTSELQSLMRISYAVFCLKKKNHKYIKRNQSY